MTISAPPRRSVREAHDPRDVQVEADNPTSIRTDAPDPARPLIEDGVIADAKRRVHRRRAAYAIAAAASTITLGALTFVMSGGPAALTDAPAEAVRWPAVLVAAGDPAEIVGEWRQIHVGWVFIYGDGRVLSYDDHAPIVERRLSQYGVDLIRSHVLEPRTLLVDRPELEALWVDHNPRGFQPQGYAACHVILESTQGPIVADVASIVPRLPSETESILRGGSNQRFSEAGTSIGSPTGESAPGNDCIVLSRAATEALVARSETGLGLPDGEPPMSANDYISTKLTTVDGDVVGLGILSLLPHGGVVFWGG